MAAKEMWLWLAAGLGYGAVNTGDLLRVYPDGAGAVAADLGSARLDEILTQKQAERLASSRPEDFALRVAHAETQGVHTLGFDDSDYPAMLRGISNPPVVLFVKGDLALMNGQLSVGIVGARRPSAYGVEAVKAIGRGVALGGAIVISGLAAGLDAEAHKAALAVNGPTIACIAFGHDHCYPAANKKLMEVIGRYGAVVSEYPLGTGAEKSYFLQRNRIIAGLSHALVVAEARRYSGTMSTVNFATDYGRDVFAVPGSIFSELSGGTNAMIREGAYLAASASDILSVYGIELQGEDPVTAAARQAAEGRPAPAGAAPAPWQQSLARFSAREREAKFAAADGDELPGQQTLGELLRGQADARPGQQVSARQAIEAFRTLQQALPAATGPELDARNRALDAMVEAVSDSVEIGARAAPRDAAPPAAKTKDGKTVTPFRWDQVERIDKKKAKSPAAGGQKVKRPEPAQRDDVPPVLSPRQTAMAAAALPTAASQPIGRVGGVTAIEPVSAVERAPAPAAASPTPAAERPAAAQQPPPRPKPPPEPEVLQTAPGASFTATLADRLRTLSYGDEEAEADRAMREAPPVRPAKKAGAGPKPPTADKTAPAAAPPGEDEPEQRPPDTMPEPPRAPRTAPAGPAEPPPPIEPERESEPATAREAAGTGADPYELLSETARRAFRQLGPRPVSLADICERSGLSSAEAMAALTELELAGLSRQLAGRQFVIMQ